MTLSMPPALTVGPATVVPTNTIALRQYQLAAVDAVRAGYRRGRRRMLLVLATGLGICGGVS